LALEPGVLSPEFVDGTLSQFVRPPVDDDSGVEEGSGDCETVDDLKQVDDGGSQWAGLDGIL